jgi:predicted dehydrogenase
MSKGPIRIGIIGCGQIAQQHMSTYAKIADAKMVGFADISEQAVQSSAKEYGAEFATTDFRELLAREDIDAIDVCLHNNFHEPATVAALEAGKHVYCEKPMAGSYADALSMLNKAQEVGKLLHIQLATLYSNETRAAKELIETGRLGDVYHARSTGFRRRGRPYVDGYGAPSFVQKRNSAGGALYDMGVYHISQILFLLNNPDVERITGKTYQKVAIDAKRLETSGYDVEELGMGFVRFAGDVSLDIIESWAIHLDSFEGSYLVGSNGGVRISPFGFFHGDGNLDLSATVDLGSARGRWNSVVGDGEVYGNSQRHWIAALQDKVPLLPTAEIALNTMLISEGIYMSQKLNREVTAEEVKAASVSTAAKM